MGDSSELTPTGVFGNLRVLGFLCVSVVLTYISLFFPQNIGKFQTVAGWPLTMQKTIYRYEGDIDPTGRISRRLVMADTRLIWTRMILNVILWMLILYGAWRVYEKAPLMKSKAPERDSHLGTT